MLGSASSIIRIGYSRYERLSWRSKLFVVYFTDGVLEATPELRDVEDIMNLGEVRG